MVGQQEDHLEVLAYRKGRLDPIPFQVDEVLADGEFVLPNGPHPVLREPIGIFGANDEIVMMTSDLGDRVIDRGMLPPQTLEIEVSDPLSRSDSYVYIAATELPSRSPDQYVTYDSRLQVVTTSAYRLKMKNNLPDTFAFRQGDAGLKRDLVQGFETRADTRLLNFLPIHFDEHDIRSEMLAYKIGPIRVLRKVRHWLSLGLGLESPTVVRTDFFYRRFIDEPIEVSLPWMPGVLFGDVRVRVDMALPDTSGLTLSWSDMEASTLNSMTDWLMLQTNSGALFGSFAPTPAIDTLTRELYYAKSPVVEGRRDTPSPPRIGYLLTNWQKLARGPQLFEFVLIRPADESNGPALWQELRVSPTVRINPPSAVARN